ncbi:MAG: DUF418 domain-containing protein [Pseudomonadota bacterium]
MRRARIELVDALRAFALAGILQVNIQSFVWGAGDSLGYFAGPPSAADAAAHLLVGTFVATKFISIFAFLFGFGAALQMRSIRRMCGGDSEAAKTVYRRRLCFLLALGVAHGLFLYYGDILAFYALAGFVLVRYMDRRPAALARATRNWWIAFAVLTVALTALLEAARGALPPEVDPALIPQDVVDKFVVFTEGGYWEQFAPRAADFAYIVLVMGPFAAPQIVALFLLGHLAARLGWIAHPERHPRVWRAAFAIGIAAAPFAVAGAWLNYETMVDSPGDPSLVGFGLQTFGSLLACLYVAAIVRWRETAPLAAAIRWLAPAGRMPLTNYLLQSVAMGALLSGWGLGLGAVLGKAQLAGLAAAIVAVQLVASRAWIARFGQGPVEALWRTVTYAPLRSRSG